MAGALGGGQGLLRLRQKREAQILRPYRVPLPLRAGPPRGPSEALHRHGHRHPEKADGRVQRPFPHGLRRLRPAHGKLRHQKPHPPRHRHQEQHRPLYPAAQAAGLRLRLGPSGGHHRSQLLQVDPVDFPPALQKGPGLQGHYAGELVHLLQVRAGQRGGGGGRVRAVRLRRHPQGEVPVDAEDHRVCPAAHRRPGRSGLHRAGENPAAQLDRPLHRRGGHLQEYRRG